MTFLRHTQPPPPSKNEQKILHFGNLANVRCKVHNLLKNTQLCFLSLFLSPLFGSLNPPEGTTLCYVAKVSLLCEMKWVSIWALAQGLSIAALQLQDAALSVSWKTLAVITGLTNRRLLDMHFYQIFPQSSWQGEQKECWWRQEWNEGGQEPEEVR